MLADAQKAAPIPAIVAPMTSSPPLPTLPNLDDLPLQLAGGNSTVSVAPVSDPKPGAAFSRIFSRARSARLTSYQQNQITRAIVYYLWDDLQPISTVESQAFMYIFIHSIGQSFNHSFIYIY